MSWSRASSAALWPAATTSRAQAVASARSTTATLSSPFARVATGTFTYAQRALVLLRGAKKKAGGSTRNGRDSVGKRLGVKVGDGEAVRTGQILVRQRGTKWLPGLSVACGRDHTLYALATGRVRYSKDRVGRTLVGVRGAGAAAPGAATPAPASTGLSQAVLLR